ncbi:acyltransferase [Chitinophaga pendula]|uniref:acyltransferase family protein n=1 Tax=Chitinophaga TaxID=79328 RepID=UPI0012FDFC50|nr:MULTISPECIES: acyltransferase [Chitinophaga]UCJ09225.1 acyltransferase [Chitinophaga pendula]
MSQQFPHTGSIFSFRPQHNGRHAWIDYAKGIAILFVVYRHVIYGLLYSGVEINDTMMDANEMLYGFRMPLFFFLSGLFFSSSQRKYGPKNFAITKVNTLLYPYLLWCIIQLTLQIMFSEYTNFKRDAGDYIDILIHPRTMLQQWYLFALFNTSVLYLFFSQVCRFKAPVQLLIGLALLSLKPYAGDISTLTDVMMHYVFFALGDLAAPYFFREKILDSLTSAPKALLLLPVFIGIQYYCMKHPGMNIYIYSAMALFGGLLVIILSLLLAKHERLTILRTIGHYSLYIYLLHLGIVFLLRFMVLKTGLQINMPLLTLFLVTAGIYGSMLLYRVCIRLGMNFLFKGPFKQVNYTPVQGSQPLKPIEN